MPSCPTIAGISDLTAAGMTAGSIEGTGNYFLGSKSLTVGGNDLSTTVSGVIADGGGFAGTGASLVKVGTGTLILSGANTYTGGTTINGGTLQLGNGGVGGSILGDVINNGTFAINRSDTFAFGGIISGTGSLVALGFGKGSGVLCADLGHFHICDRTQPTCKRRVRETVRPEVAALRQAAALPCLDMHSPPFSARRIFKIFRCHRRTSHERRNPIWNDDALAEGRARLGRLSHQPNNPTIGRQDKAGCPAGGAMRLKPVCTLFLERLATAP
jgi:autotransporter-associated beta strand protein